jgi:hypothetical protein
MINLVSKANYSSDKILKKPPFVAVALFISNWLLSGLLLLALRSRELLFLHLIVDAREFEKCVSMFNVFINVERNR